MSILSAMTHARAAGLSSCRQVEGIISIHTRPFTLTDLAAHLSLSSAAVTGMADLFVKKGLAVRCRTHLDRRVITLALTKSGEELAQRLLHP